MRARGDVFVVVEEGFCEGVFEDALLDFGKLGGRGREEGEGFLVAGRAGEGPHGLDCRGAGHDEASCEGSEGERDRDGESDVERSTRSCRRRWRCRDSCVCLRFGCCYLWLARYFTLPQRPPLQQEGLSRAIGKQQRQDKHSPTVLLTLLAPTHRGPPTFIHGRPNSPRAALVANLPCAADSPTCLDPANLAAWNMVLRTPRNAEIECRGR